MEERKFKHPLRNIWLDISLRRWELLPYQNGSFTKYYRSPTVEMVFLCFKLYFAFGCEEVERKNQINNGI